MKKRLAYLLIAALLLSCLSGTALAVQLGDIYGKCPMCNEGDLIINGTYPYNSGHDLYAFCNNCGYYEIAGSEGHNVNGTTCLGTVCPVCNYRYRNYDNHDSSCTLQWTTTATTHKGVWSGCKLEVAEAAHNWSTGECKDCGYVCTHSSGTQEWRSFSPRTHIQVWSCCGLPISGEAEAHSWSNGVCTVCNENCEHTEYADGVCIYCGSRCTSAPESATCTKAAHCSFCGSSHTNPDKHDSSCTLQWISTSATTHKQAYSGCGKVVVAEAAHSWNKFTGVCSDCKYACTHDDGKNEKKWVSVGGDVHYLTWSCCRTYVDDNPKSHRWSDGKCSDCGEVCGHKWVNGVCAFCDLVCTHDWADGVCKTCKSTCAHDYDSATGVCRTCKLACVHSKTAVDAAIAPTCTAKGVTEGKHCTVCQKVLQPRRLVNELGHEFKTYTYNGDASCTEDGTETAKCVRYGTGGCKETRTRTAVGTMTEHTAVIDAAVAPTCTETGLTEGKHCADCKEVLVKQQTVDPKGHEFKVYTYNKDATCTEDGTETAKCVRYGTGGCKETHTRTAAGTMTEHTAVIDAAVAPTCTETGLTEGRHCSVCQTVLVKQNVVPAKGHSGVIDAAVAPTCTETGLTEGRHCSVCQTVLEEQQVVPALGHDYQAEVTLPSCTKGGYTTYTCTRCTDSYVADRTAKLGHLYGAWTLDGDGAHGATCLREDCGGTETASCETVEVCLIVEAEEQTYVLCPICGALSDGSRLELVEQALAVADVLPNGTPVLRMGAIENGEMLMSLCFERGGRMLLLEGRLQITLPAGLLEGCALMRLGAEGEETELPFTVDGNEASFTLEFAEEGEFFALIHLVPVE